MTALLCIDTNTKVICFSELIRVHINLSYRYFQGTVLPSYDLNYLHGEVMVSQANYHRQLRLSIFVYISSKQFILLFKVTIMIEEANAG